MDIGKVKENSIRNRKIMLTEEKNTRKRLYMTSIKK